MTEPLAPRQAGPRPHHRLGTVALLTALMVGCTTVRQPVARMEGPIPIRDGVGVPQLELWLESARPVTPEEATAATGEARAALEAALAGRRIGDGSLVLVVREQGVSRTASHRSDQTAATVGLVLGAVVVVVAVVVLVASGGKGGRSGSGGGAVAAGGRGLRPVPGKPPAVSPALPLAGARAAPVRAGAAAGALASRPAPARPPPIRPWPGHRDHGPAVAVGVYVNPGPVTFQDGAPAEVVSTRELGPGEAAALAPPAEGPTPLPGPEEDQLGAPDPIAEVALPALPPLPLDERGFFAGDALVLELTLVDAITGEPRWQKWVQEEADPCDRDAVRAILDRALDEARGWAAFH